jgi:uncharacterized membrane protein (DUF4010 family)
VLGASTVLLPRVAIVAAILNQAVAATLVPFLAAPAVIGLVIVVTALVRQRRDRTEAILEERNPLRLWTAIQLAIALQAVIMIMVLVQETWGSPGVVASAAVLGLTDVDALTLSMSKMGGDPGLVGLAAQAIVVGVIANTVMKLGMALVLGSAGFRWRVAGGLLALGAALGAGLLVAG